MCALAKEWKRRNALVDHNYAFENDRIDNLHWEFEDPVQESNHRVDSPKGFVGFTPEDISSASLKMKHARRHRSATSHTDPIIEVGLRELSEERLQPIRDPQKKVHFTVPPPQRGQPWRYEGRSVPNEFIRAQYNQVCDEEVDDPDNTEDCLVMDIELDDEQQATLDELSRIRPDTPTNTDNSPSDDEMLSSLRVPNKISLDLPNDDREFFDDETTQRTLMSYFQSDDQGTDEAQYGELKNIPVGCTWKNRRLMAQSNVHKHQKARIHGGPKGVYSMVMSSPNLFEDFGNEVSFFGEGGRDSKTLKLIADQKLENGNMALMNSYLTKTHLRMIRGAQLKSQVSPKTGYRYDGLYEVSNYSEVMRDGFRIYRFQLLRAGHQPPPPWPSKSVEFPTPIDMYDGVYGLDEASSAAYLSMCEPTIEYTSRVSCSNGSSSSGTSDRGNSPPLLSHYEANTTAEERYPLSPHLPLPSYVTCQNVVFKKLYVNMGSQVKTSPEQQLSFQTFSEPIKLTRQKTCCKKMDWHDKSEENMFDKGRDTHTKVNLPVSIPKKRGRPFKLKQVSHKDTKCVKLKLREVILPLKKRGRPCKVDVKKRGRPHKVDVKIRGRPRKADLKKRGRPCKVDVKKRGRPCKVDLKKRGRPRKVDLKKRGRPRKVDVKKRGRPRKVDVKKRGRPCKVDVKIRGRPRKVDVPQKTEVNRPLKVVNTTLNKGRSRSKKGQCC